MAYLVFGFDTTGSHGQRSRQTKQQVLSRLRDRRTPHLVARPSSRQDEAKRRQSLTKRVPSLFLSVLSCYFIAGYGIAVMVAVIISFLIGLGTCKFFPSLRGEDTWHCKTIS